MSSVPDPPCRPSVAGATSGRLHDGARHDDAVHADASCDEAKATPVLRDYWSRQLAVLRGEAAPGDARMRHRDRVLLDVLGLGLEPTLRFLGTLPTFPAFARYVRDAHGGRLADDRLAWVEAIHAGDAEHDPASVRAFQARVPAHAPVLDDDDLAQWRDDGVVVVREALAPAECAAARRVVEAFVGADPDDPATWYDAGRRQGIMVQLFGDPALEVARTSARVHAAFAQVWGTCALVASTDRCGFNPPETANFRFPGPHLHWDALLEPPLAFDVQGLIYLTDTPPEQGAFTCIPGFHRRIDAWLRDLPAGVDPHAAIPVAQARPIAGRAGDLVIWRHALPHGSRPNRGTRPRIVQYLTLYPARRA